MMPTRIGLVMKGFARIAPASTVAAALFHEKLFALSGAQAAGPQHPVQSAVQADAGNGASVQRPKKLG